MSHTNDGNCQKCEEIFNKYPGFYDPLKSWFKLVQAKFTNFHISDAGRGKIDQELYCSRGASNAHYGQSSHSYNAAIDTFFLVDGKYNLGIANYLMIEPEIPDFIEWYGDPACRYYERPHYQCKNWKDLVAQGVLKLVE